LWVDRRAYEIAGKTEAAWDPKQNEDYLPHFRECGVDCLPAATECALRLPPKVSRNEITRIENLSYE